MKFQVDQKLIYLTFRGAFALKVILSKRKTFFQLEEASCDQLLLVRVLIRAKKTQIMWENISFPWVGRAPPEGPSSITLVGNGLTYSHTDQRTMLKHCHRNIIHKKWENKRKKCSLQYIPLYFELGPILKFTLRSIIPRVEQWVGTISLS